VTFVLVHMSCAAAWAWGRVPDLLRAAGHDVLAPDLDLSAGQTPETHADAVAERSAGGGALVLAGHSYGGMVLPPLAQRLGGRVKALVVIDGLIPDSGESAFALRPHSAAARRAAAAERGDGMFPPEVEPDAPEWTRRLVPMPISAFEAPVRFDSLPAARTFVHCTRSDMGEQARRARERGWRVITADAGHALPLEDPGLCARLLLEEA
jgi:pimeloyl-ACP methyl ester carboxylesterase